MTLVQRLESESLLKSLQDQMADPVNQLYFFQNPELLSHLSKTIEELERKLFSHIG